MRLRLTLLYGSLFLASGAALLAITYLLVRHSTGDLVLFRDAVAPGAELRPRPSFRDLPSVGLSEPFAEQVEEIRSQAASQRSDQLRELVVQSGIALAIMAVISIALGWVMAGRVLRPLRTMTATTRRISERNLHERLALAGPSDELTELGDTIDGLLGRLEAAFEAQRRFVANASHELRTPLAMMRTSLDVATGKPGPAPPELAALERKLREGLNRADRLLEDFLTLARAERGSVSERRSVALAKVVSAAIEDRSEAIAKRGIAVSAKLRDANLVGSRTLLAHLAENLVDNAVRHNDLGGWISVETRADGRSARLVVENGGARLEATDVRELAQPFRRVGAERTGSENGVGLGLSIVAAIAAAHGGGLELQARPEGGLRALVELPRAAGGLASGAVR